MHMNYFGLPSSVFATDSGTAVAMTTAGTAHVKGAWSTLIASTSRVANRLGILMGDDTVFRDGLIDVGIGAAASEIVIINNIPISEISDVTAPVLDFPVSIPVGSRIAARQQVTGTTGQFFIHVRPYWGYVPPGTHDVKTYGANTATSVGTGVDASGTANTKGSWTEITSSTTSHHSTLWVTVPGNGVSRVSTKVIMDIGIGGSGSEVVLIPNIGFAVSSITDHFQPNYFGPFYVNIPAGSRLSARTAFSVSTSGSARITHTILFGA